MQQRRDFRRRRIARHQIFSRRDGRIGQRRLKNCNTAATANTAAKTHITIFFIKQTGPPAHSRPQI